MASSLPLRQKLADTLAYFAKYNYPLTLDELWYWQHGTRFSKSKILSLSNGLKLEIRNLKLRQQRFKFSQKKWLIARRVGDKLSRIPTIAAVFVTGALAMNNCPKDDDIDLMIVTYPNCLWPTRFFVVIYLKLLKLRRQPPTTKSQRPTANRICDNLWLDTNHLAIIPHDLYRAHEILQAKCIMDRCNIHQRFLQENSWIKKFLPVAYNQQLKSLGQLKIRSIRSINPILYILNILFFAAQYLYMFPKKTTERVGLGFAFFHPKRFDTIPTRLQRKKEKLENTKQTTS